MIDCERLSLAAWQASTPDTLTAIDKLLTALDTAGYCIVPKEATDEMRQAAQDAGDEYYLGDGITWDEIPVMYRAMVAKAQEGQ